VDGPKRGLSVEIEVGTGLRGGGGETGTSRGQTTPCKVEVKNNADEREKKKKEWDARDGEA